MALKIVVKLRKRQYLDKQRIYMLFLFDKIGLDK